jgi:hypothetical protein
MVHASRMARMLESILDRRFAPGDPIHQGRTRAGDFDTTLKKTHEKSLMLERFSI